MDACHSTSATLPQQSSADAMVDHLPRKLGHNGPYFGAVDPVAQDCDKLSDHSNLFRSLDDFEPDLRTAAGLVRHVAGVTDQAAITIAETGVEDNGAVAEAAGHLRMAARYLADAQLIAEVMEDREELRLSDREARSFLDMVKGI